MGISAIISKLFKTVYYSDSKFFLSSSDSQFGFKPGFSCPHAIYSVRKVVDHYINGGSTVNMCTIDMSKAYDKMNHCASFLKLINSNTSSKDNLMLLIQ